MNKVRAVARWGVLLACGAALAQSPLPPQTVGPAYRAQVEQYRKWRMNDDKMNWATLAGLFWLQPGAASFGTAAVSNIVLPRGSAAARVGSFEFQNGEVRVKLERGIAASLNGQPFTGGKLASDRDGKAKPEIMRIGKLEFRVIQRGQRTGIRLKDLASPNLKRYREPEWYPIDPAYHVVARWEPGDGKRTIIVPNVLGDATPVVIAGTAYFTLNGREYALTPYTGDPNKSMEFIFADATTKTETYPAGRMVDVGAVTDGKLVIDFNEAYSPPCAVTAFATCPIAPKENRLTARVRAGAKFGAKERAEHKAPVLPE
jgi:uncharacterized protein (DUF1684 family)